jgi:hypothetical protein
MRRLIVGVLLSAAMVACSSPSKATFPSNTKGIPAGKGRLTGRVGPGAPPAGTVPRLTLTFSNGTATKTAAVTAGTYQVDLPPGVWSVRSPDGRVCASGLHVGSDAWQRDDLMYPIAGCQDLAPPPDPITPPAPTTP